jgi:flavodoxin
MKGIIVYDSSTGNTKKIAEAIASETRFDVVKVGEAPTDLRQYDILVLGSPNIRTNPSKAIFEFMDKVLLPDRYVLFITFGVPLWGQISSLICLNKMRKLLSKKGACCKAKFLCPGYHVKFKTYRGWPREKEINRARRFARKVLIN